MKTFTFTVLSLQSLVLAQNITDIGEKKFDHIKGMISYLLTGTHDDDTTRRNIRDKIQDYGCFCYPGDSQQVRFSKAKPVDEIDALCKSLHRRWKCLESDAEQQINDIS